MDKQTFLGHLVVLADATNKDLSDGLIELWWRKFGQLDAAIFAAAIDRALDTTSFFPSPVEFSAAVEAEMTPEERAMQEGIRLWRGWLLRGILPACRDGEELAAIRAALGLPAPSQADRAMVEARHAALVASLVAQGWDLAAAESLSPGPVMARLLGADVPQLAAAR